MSFGGRGMDNFFIVALPILVIAIIAITVFVVKRKTNSANANVIDDSIAFVPIEDGNVSILIENLSDLSTVDESSLAEITDTAVISRITQTIPTVAEKAAKTITSNALQNADIVRVIIPKGETLVKSKDMTGAFRGFFQGAKGAKGHANLVKVDPSKITKTSALANVGANVMNVGSLVVGQYYMSEISAKLETMNRNISKISDFQDKEFKSRIMSLIALVVEISQFSTEIIENDELRVQKIAVLENKKADATELLGQVNETIIGISQNTPNPDFKIYQEKVDDFNILVSYQNILITMLGEISKLLYLLGKGGISSELCYASYNKYWELSTQAKAVLENWHDKQVETLKIDLDKNRLTKSGVEGFFAQIPAFINDKYKYKEIKQGLADKINTQAQAKLTSVIEPKSIYDNDVQIIIKDGKYFYLRGE